MLKKPLFLAVLVWISAGAVAQAQEPVDLNMINRIRDQGFHHSQVIEILRHLTDDIGPRLTGSPQMREANRWTRDMFAKWGLKNAHLEDFEFGRGWSFTKASVRMIAPTKVPLIALPEAWTPGTEGPVEGAAVKVAIDAEEDFERYRGKLAGKIVMLDPPRPRKEPSNKLFVRFTDEELARLAVYKQPSPKQREGRLIWLRNRLFREKLYRFLAKEGVKAAINISSRDGALIRVTGYTYRPGTAPAFPVLVMASEHYGRIMRLLDDGTEVTLEIDVAARFYDDDPKAYNTIAEIPGKGIKPEIVMAGAHLDSWHGGTGAVDNGAGSAVVMEAARILKALNVKPRRTIRFALWSGEEQGLLGSHAYVSRHFASRPEPEDPTQKELPYFLREPTWPLQLKPDHKRLSAYFNIDNGSGRIRGIYGEENVAAKPIFAAWFAPFRDLEVKTETLRGTRGTDHLSFEAVGLPGFQFIQDRLDYFSRLHHTNIDTFDHVQPDDLRQASVILAAFLYQAAMREDRLPRKPLPVAPTAEEKARDDKERQRAIEAREREFKRKRYWDEIRVKP